MIFFKITKNKIKLLFFIYFISLLITYPFIFLTAIISRNIGFENYKKVNVIFHLLSYLKLFIVSYATILFLRKEFFIKKYFIDFIKVFFILFILGEISSKITTLFYKVFPSEIFLSNATQILGLILQIIISYIAVCFIVSFVDKKQTIADLK